MKNLMEKYINILKNTPLFQGISEAEILPMMMFGEIAILLQSYHQECSMAKAMPASAVFLLKSVLLLMKISLSCFSI